MIRDIHSKQRNGTVRKGVKTMSVIVNTNVQSLVSQRNLSSATNALNKSTQRLSTGLKINSAADDAAGLFVAKGLESQLSGSEQCQTNIALGINVLQIAEGDLVNIQDNVSRIKDLATQASSGIYSSAARSAMQEEINSRLLEINRIANASNFNCINLLDGNQMLSTGLRIQVGAGSDETVNVINITEVFGSATASGLNLDILRNVDPNAEAGQEYLKYDAEAGEYVACSKEDAIAALEAAKEDDSSIVSSLSVSTAAISASVIQTCEDVLTTITSRRSSLGVAQARLEMASAGLATSIENISAAKATIMDTDIAAETSNYTKQQILQQISSSVLTQANQAPAIALSLMG